MITGLLLTVISDEPASILPSTSKPALQKADTDKNTDVNKPFLKPIFGMNCVERITAPSISNIIVPVKTVLTSDFISPL